MTTGYPAELSALEAAAGSPIEIERIQNAALARALHGLLQLLSAAVEEIRELRTTVNRRTAVFTPARGFRRMFITGMVWAFTFIRFVVVYLLMITALRASEFLDHDIPNPGAGSLILPRNEVLRTTFRSPPVHHPVSSAYLRSFAPVTFCRATLACVTHWRRCMLACTT